MPCNCDYLNPTQLEEESKHVAQLLCYVYKNLNKTPSIEVKEAAKHIYGNEKLANEFTAELCSLLRSFNEDQENKIIYNAKNKTSRALADWWEEHQKHDAERERLEKKAIKDKNKEKLDQAWKKLTIEQKEKLIKSHYGDKPL